jgi:hypothetical protein
MRESKNTNIFT